MKPMKRIYRFRNTHALLDGFHELENQEFYFAKIEELNDPMEGYRQYFWNGDHVLWRNLLKHYLLCLYNSYIRIGLENEEYLFTDKDILIGFFEEQFSDIGKLGFQNICDRFFNLNSTNKLIEFLEKSKSLKEEEVTFFLSLIHDHILSEVEYKAAELHNLEIAEPKQSSDDHLSSLLQAWTAMSEQTARKDSPQFKAVMQTVRSFHQSHHLMNYHKNASLTKHKEFFLYQNFVPYYVKSIKDLIYPEVYIACFMENYKNAASWGHYADSHKGVCLIFESEEENEYLTLPIGQNSEERNSYHPEKLYKIKYEGDFVRIDFFSSIGMIPSPQIIKQWYTDRDAAVSRYARHLIDENEYVKWHKQHWQEFIPGYTFKLEAWSYEQESRLIINNLLGNEYDDISSRKLKYDFQCLKGIIFGMRTTPQDKLKIISVIQKLCNEHNRKDFEFYQAETSLDSSEIEALPLQMKQLFEE